MVVIMKAGTNKEEVEQVIGLVKALGCEVPINDGVECTVLGLVGDTSVIDPDTIMLNQYVDRVMRIQEPYKKSSRKFHPESSVVEIGSAKVGAPGTFTVIAGPCSVESKSQILDVARGVKEAGAKLMRGGAYKPRTSPYSFQGLEFEGIKLLKEARELTGLPIVTEIMSPFLIDVFNDNVDVIQVGARSMQNFDLLKELGRLDKPILLKRGPSSTIEEWLMSAEYILSEGNNKVMLCERGIRTFETYTRNTLDVSAIPAIKKQSHLPIIVDPSHSAGMSWMVEPLSLAAMAAGADGLIVEVHNDPKRALCDGPQSLDIPQFEALMDKMKNIGKFLGREIEY